MNRHLIAFSLGSFLLCINPAAHSQIYKWVDEEGNVHFGDQQSKADEAKDISKDLKKLNVSEGSNSGYIPSGESAAERKERLREEKQETLAAREPACKEARKQLRIVSGPVYFTNEDGSEYTISEAERAELEAELRADIKRYCK